MQKMWQPGAETFLSTSKSGQHLISPYNITIESESQE